MSEQVLKEIINVFHKKKLFLTHVLDPKTDLYKKFKRKVLGYVVENFKSFSVKQSENSRRVQSLHENRGKSVVYLNESHFFQLLTIFKFDRTKHQEFSEEYERMVVYHHALNGNHKYILEKKNLPSHESDSEFDSDSEDGEETFAEIVDKAIENKDENNSDDFADFKSQKEEETIREIGKTIESIKSESPRFLTPQPGKSDMMSDMFITKSNPQSQSFMETRLKHRGKRTTIEVSGVRKYRKKKSHHKSQSKSYDNSISLRRVRSQRQHRRISSRGLSRVGSKFHISSKSLNSAIVIRDYTELGNAVLLSDGTSRFVENEVWKLDVFDLFDVEKRGRIKFDHFFFVLIMIGSRMHHCFGTFFSNFSRKFFSFFAKNNKQEIRMLDTKIFAYVLSFSDVEFSSAVYHCNYLKKKLLNYTQFRKVFQKISVCRVFGDDEYGREKEIEKEKKPQRAMPYESEKVGVTCGDNCILM